MRIASQSLVATRATNSAALVAGEVLGAGGQQPCLRVELQPLAGELLEHVVGDHDAGLRHHPEPPQLHARRSTISSVLPGPDLRETGRRPARDASARPRRADARCGENVRAIPGSVRRSPVGGVVAQHEAVEPPVVLGQQPRGAVGVLPHPLGEALLQRLGLLHRGGGLVGVHDPRSPSTVSSVTWTGRCSSIALAIAGAGIRPVPHSLVAATDSCCLARPRSPRPGARRRAYWSSQQLSQELLVGVGVDPRGAEPGLRSSSTPSVARQHRGLERGRR